MTVEIGWRLAVVIVICAFLIAIVWNSKGVDNDEG